MMMMMVVVVIILWNSLRQRKGLDKQEYQGGRKIDGFAVELYVLFVILIEAIYREFRVALPWELLYADDLLVIAETEEDLIKRLNEWKNNMENY